MGGDEERIGEGDVESKEMKEMARSVKKGSSVHASVSYPRIKEGKLGLKNIVRK